MLRGLIFLTIITYTFTATPCSVAMLRSSHPLIAHNLDWPYVEGFAVIHPRGESHQAKIDDKTLTPLSWIAHFGNIIFHGGNDTQHIYASAEGMNEKGLFASALMMKRSEYPHLPKHSKALDTTHWVQYALDNFQSVDELIQAQPTLNMVANTYKLRSMKLHLYVADKAGHQAVIEYINGDLLIHDEHNMPQPVLTNDAYDTSLQYLTDYQGFGGDKPLPGGYGSEARFVKVASFLKRLNRDRINAHPIALGFSLLNDAAEAPYTPMQTIISDVYDLSTLHVYYKSIFNQSTREVELSKIDFNTLSHPIYIEVHKKETKR